MLTNYPQRDFRVELPFLRNQNLDCGPIALEMALRYLGDRTPSDKIKTLVNAETSGLTATVGIAAAAADLGYAVKFRTTSLVFTSANENLDYYQRHLDSTGDDLQRKLANLTSRCRAAGGDVLEAATSLEEIESAVRSGALAILLLDWHKVINANGYAGHFVPIVGFNEKSVLVHHSGGVRPEPQPFFPIDRDVFEQARTAVGTDQDVVMIRGKSPRPMS